MIKPHTKKIMALVTLVLTIFGLAYWQVSTSEPQTAVFVKPEAPQPITDPQALQAEAEGQRFFESFVATYNSYRQGDSSNIESLYDSMSPELRQREEAKVAKLRQEEAMSGQPAQYVTVESRVQGSQIDSFADDQMVIRVTIDKTTYNGAYLPDPEGSANDSYILVDKSGAKYGGQAEDLVQDKKQELYRVTGNRQGGEWQVSEVQLIKP